MRILFSIFSLLYIAAIFILAGSPEVRILSEFNPYSRLHIPLYGGLTLLLVVSMVPVPHGFKRESVRLGNDSTAPRGEGTISVMVRFFLSGAIAMAVGVLDEVHQLSVPGRDGSAGDVALDLVGIAIALFLCFWFFKTRVFHRPDKPAQSRNYVDPV